MTRRRIMQVLILVVVLSAAAYGLYRWSPWVKEPTPEILGDLSALIPNDLVAVIGQVNSVDSDGLTIIIEHYASSSDGTYLAQEERVFRFNEHTNIFMLLRDPEIPLDQDVTGDRFEELEEKQTGIGPEELLLGTPVTVLYSSSDANTLPIAWVIYISEP